MSGAKVFDTNVLVDFLRGAPKAIEYLESAEAPLLISAMSVAELYVGVRDAGEAARLAEFLEAFEVIPVDGTIAKRAGEHRRRYGKTHGVDLIDATIAATAEARGAVLVTINVRHFPMLAKVEKPY